MPLYKYKCPRCGWEDEQLRKHYERNDVLACGGLCWDQMMWIEMKLQLSAPLGVVKNPAVPRRTK